MLSKKIVSAFIAGCIFTFIIVYLIAIFERDSFWLMPLNQGGKAVKEFHVSINNKFFGLTGAAVRSDESELIVAEVNEPSTYYAIVVFTDGSQIKSDPRKVEPGWGIYERIYNDRVEQEIRIR